MEIPFNEDEQADAFFNELLAAVDQQLESRDTPYVGKTLKRLIKEGMSHDEAREAIARCLAEETDKVVRGGKPFDTASYRMLLESISPGS